MDPYLQQARRLASGPARKRDKIREWIAAAGGCRWCPETHPACLGLHSLDPGLPARQVYDWARRNYRWSRIEAFLTSTCIVLCLNCRTKYRAQTGVVDPHVHRRRDVRAMADDLVAQDRRRRRAAQAAWMKARWADPQDPIQQTRARLHSPEHLRKMREAKKTK